MRLYFVLFDADRFHGQIVPALAASWRERRFDPCRPLCEGILSHWHETELGTSATTLCARIARGGLRFDRDIWRLLVGEVLLYSAAELPEIETMPVALSHLLGSVPGRGREHFHWIDQVHYGTRDLCFGGGYYHPEQAGYNDLPDVARLADCLAAVRPETWKSEQLLAMPALETDEDRDEELEYVREWYPSLSGMYAGAREKSQVIVCETP